MQKFDILQEKWQVHKSLLFSSAWRAWIENPILTSVKSTGLNVKDIEHPAIIICGQGSNYHTPVSALFQQALDYKKGNHTIGLVSHSILLFRKMAARWPSKSFLF